MFNAFPIARASAANMASRFASTMSSMYTKSRDCSPSPWMKGFGALKHLHKENVRIQKLIDEEFEKIDPEDWE